jgi:hypothetical protein
MAVYLNLCCTTHQQAEGYMVRHGMTSAVGTVPRGVVSAPGKSLDVFLE